MYLYEGNRFCMSFASIAETREWCANAKVTPVIVLQNNSLCVDVRRTLLFLETHLFRDRKPNSVSFLLKQNIFTALRLKTLSQKKPQTGLVTLQILMHTIVLCCWFVQVSLLSFPLLQRPWKFVI